MTSMSLNLRAEMAVSDYLDDLSNVGLHARSALARRRLLNKHSCRLSELATEVSGVATAVASLATGGPGIGEDSA